MIRPKEIPRILKHCDTVLFIGWHIRLVMPDGKTYDCRWPEYQQALEKMRKTDGRRIEMPKRSS